MAEMIDKQHLLKFSTSVSLSSAVAAENRLLIPLYSS